LAQLVSSEPVADAKLRYLYLLLALIICIGGGAASGLATPPGDWYAALAKPTWTPPGWVFGPAWTLLYTLMAVAAWTVWRRRQQTSVRVPLTLFAVQLALNFAWTPLFFGMHQPGFALAEILVMLVAIMATTVSFGRVSAPAAWMMAPYCAWVCFATALNWAIWKMN
jgi:tryptophan-rich sensory protein